MSVVRRKYSDVEVTGALKAVDANRGMVRPTAAAIGVPHQTLQRWANEDTDQAARARRLSLGAKVDESLHERFLDIIAAAQERTMEALPKATAYQSALIAAISFDKRQLILGRPTSVSASMVRYVQADSLQQLAAKRMQALGSGRSEPTPRRARAKVVVTQANPVEVVASADTNGTADS